MAVEAGKYHHGDGSYDFALGEDESAGDAKGGKKVIVFSEPGGTYQIFHNVPEGTGDGEFHT